MSEVEADKVDNLPFKWGKRKGVGGKKKEVQFYESFTYDGVDYTLYDCVYMYKEGEPGPYVGKLIKIWEHANKTKKVKLQWFFQPYEIVSWLGNEEVSVNEIFLASGEGVGLANVNPLEAIAGKCSVVCISKDSRNRQPSAKELQMADYIFYRTFDVGHFSISDRLDDKVGGLEVKFVFNTEGSDPPVEGKDGGSSHLALKGSENVKSPVIKSKLSPRGESASDSPDDLNEVATSSGLLETVPGEITSRNRDSQEHEKVKESVDMEDSLTKLKSSPKGESAVGAQEDSSGVITANGRHEPVSGGNTKRSGVDFHKEDTNVSLKEPIKHGKESYPYRTPRGRGRGQSNVWYRDNQTSSSTSKKQKTHHQKMENTADRLGKEGNTRHQNEGCYRCGMTGHWSRTCRTPQYFRDLYQASIKAKVVEANHVHN